MWKKLRFPENPYFIIVRNLGTEEHQYEILATNYVTLWYSIYRKNDIIENLKKNNPHIEIDNDSLLEQGAQMLLNPEALDVDIKKNDDDECLYITFTKSFGYVLYFKLEFLESSSFQFFSHVIQPMWETIHDLKASQDELCKLLEKKDSEIEDYKSKGGDVVLRCLKTPKFNREAFMAKHTTYNENFGMYDIPSLILEYKELFNKLIHGKSTNKVKTEPFSQQSTDNETSNIISTNVKQELVKEENIKQETSHLNNNHKRKEPSASSNPIMEIKPELSGDTADSVTVIKNEQISNVGKRRKRKPLNL